MGTNASILLIKKAGSITSFSSLNAIKRAVDPKVGHAGTLDKFAEGLLIVLTGSMTKLNVLFSSMDKSYRATIHFGMETDTLDPEGEVIATSPIPSYETVKEAISHFLGPLEQAPPQYSALHIGGKRASDLARKGKVVEMAKRPITVYEFTPIKYEDGVLIADISVSKGTYIRSIARDLGLACNSRAYLSALVRTRIGPYHLDEAVDPKQKEAVLASLANTDEYMKRVQNLSLLEVPNHELFQLSNGTFPRSYRFIRENEGNQYGALYSRDGTLRAVADLTRHKLIAQIHPFRKEEES